MVVKQKRPRSSAPHLRLPVSVEFRLGRLLAELGFVLRGVFVELLRVANETLRIGTVVLFAPVAFLLEVGGDLGVALSTFGFGDAVLVAPPAVVTVAGFLFAVIVAVPFVMFVAVFVAGVIGVFGLRHLFRRSGFATAGDAIARGDQAGQQQILLQQIHVRFLSRWLVETGKR